MRRVEFAHERLYDPRFEHDSCGVGFVATTAGRSHMVLQRALEAVANLTHRGAVPADGKTGDGSPWWKASAITGASR